MTEQKKYTVTLIPGDGIGPEVTSATRKVLAAAGVVIDWEIVNAGQSVVEKTGTTLPDETLAAIKKNKVALKGPLTTPIGGGFKSVNVELRKSLDLYANFRPVRSALGISFHHSAIDLAIFRENTEDLYAGMENEIAPGVAQGLKIITEKASRRIARFAFDWADNNNRKTVHAVHKANIMKKSDGMFLRSVRDIAKEYSNIKYKEIIVDNCAMQLVMRPEQFDVLVLTNLYGDIISDLAAGLVGGLGMVPGANIGDTYAVFESVHGSASDIAGKGIANPLAPIASAVLMLRHLGEEKVAARIRAAIILLLAERKYLTPDLGGKHTTHEITDALIEKIKMLK